MKRYRVEIRGSHDPWLIAKFFEATSPQDAAEKAMRMYGDHIKTDVTLDRDGAQRK